MGFLGGLVGGLSGLATGGLVGGLAGLGGGLLNSPESRTTYGTSSGTSSQRSSSNMQGMNQTLLRQQSGMERQAQQTAMQGLLQNIQSMTPEQLDAMRQAAYSNIYNPAAQAINQAYDTQNAQQYASASRRGVGGSSRQDDQQMLSNAARSRELGQASQQASLGAAQMALAEQANRRQAAASLMDQVNALWQQRLYGSKNVSSQSGTQDTSRKWNERTSQTGPDTFIPDAFGGIGAAAADPNSWLSQNVTPWVNDLFGA